MIIVLTILSLRFLPLHLYTKVFFIVFILLGVIIAINATNPLLIWIGLEINLISFLPLMLESDSNISSSNIIKYFLIQTITSLIILFSIIGFNLKFSPLRINRLFLISLFVKIGLPPYHFWLPSVIQSISWINCLILSTVQKFGPLLLILAIHQFSKLRIILAILSLLIRSLGGLAQTNLRPLIAYSSIHHIVWCFLGLIINFSLFYFYFLAYIIACIGLFITLHSYQIYSFKTITSIHVNYIGVAFVRIISLAGLPPLLGFFPKLFLLINLCKLRIFITLFIVIRRSINLVFYFNFILSLLFLKIFTYKWSDLPYRASVPIFLITLTPYIIIISIIISHSAMVLLY